MEVIGFLVFFGALIAHLYAVKMDSLSFIGVCIGIGLCAIAGALREGKK